jgi:hypothetical protein
MSWCCDSIQQVKLSAAAVVSYPCKKHAILCERTKIAFAVESPKTIFGFVINLHLLFINAWK